MARNLTRRICVLLLAFLVTAGMGLPAIQASAMSLKMMDMATRMAMTGTAKCQDCDTSGPSKDMAACVTPAFTAQVTAHAPSVMELDLGFAPVGHRFTDHILLGRDTVPDPYPPRTSDIG